MRISRSAFAITGLSLGAVIGHAIYLVRQEDVLAVGVGTLLIVVLSLLFLITARAVLRPRSRHSHAR